MASLQEELISMLNSALELEHAARIQYLAHAEQVSGLYAEPVISRLKEIANDELKHEQKFRTLIGDYLGGVPTMRLGEVSKATSMEDIFHINIRQEKHGIDLYQQIYEKIIGNKTQLQYQYQYMEHEIRHIIVDEEEHIAELSRLLGR
jgi:bacterioferritin (cytochrome b1)